VLQDRFVQPRQIYASTLERRDRRWRRRRNRGLWGLVIAAAGALAPAAAIVAAVTQNLH